MIIRSQIIDYIFFKNSISSELSENENAKQLEKFLTNLNRSTSSPTQELKIVENGEESEDSSIADFKEKILNTKLVDVGDKAKENRIIHPDKRLIRGQSHSVLSVKRE